MNVSPNPAPINPSEITLEESLLHVSWVKVSYANWQGRSVVVKQLRLTEKGDPTLEDCRREATLLHDSRHSNIVGLYGICNKTTEYWLVLERIAKGALDQVLFREELPWKTRLRIANDMTSGLNYLHGKGLLHRDIKSSNILIDENNRAKLADFGIAKPEKETSTKTPTQGTWNWCAPEVIENRKFTKHSDTYALGVVFWELSSREAPFQDRFHHATCEAILKGIRPEMLKSTPAPFAMLIRGCWSHHAEARPLCPEILECLRPMIQPEDPPPSSFSATHAAAAATVVVMNVSTNPTPINPSEITLGESLLHVSWVKVSYAIWQGKSVVVKQLRLTEKGDPTLEDCRREATLLHDSRHSNIVGLCGICNKTTEYWLVLERIAKGSLDQVLFREKLPWETRLRMANDMTSGLNYLHGKGLLHRHIKSSNILIDENCRAKLADFGIAKPEKDTSTKTPTQGTWKWCAPEVIENRKFTKHSDTYALGMVFWELSSRETPFQDRFHHSTCEAILKGIRPEMPKNTPAPFAMLIRGCWSHHAEARPLCPEILECLRPMIQPEDPPPSSFSATHAAAAASVSILSDSPSATSLAASPSQAPRTVADLTGLLETLTLKDQVLKTNIPKTPAILAENVYNLPILDQMHEINLRMQISQLIDSQSHQNPVEIDAETPSATPLAASPSSSAAFTPTLPPLSTSTHEILNATTNVPKTPIATPLAANSSSSAAFTPTLPLAIPPLVFGSTAWNTHFGDVGTEPPLPTNIHEILNTACPYWPGKKFSETHMLVLIPEKVNGCPLTLKTLGELVKTPKKGNASKYKERSFFHTYGDTRAPASHWILMTRDVIPGSRSQSFTAQKALLKKDYTVPKLLDATTAIFMQNASGGKHGYVRGPDETYTRCEESYNELQMVVGSLETKLVPDNGLYVDYAANLLRIGVAAAWKFV